MADVGYTIQEYWEMHAKLTAQIMDERAACLAQALSLAREKEELARKAMWGYIIGIAGAVSAIVSVIALLTK